ncbi:glycoside hydrolase family 3 protein [Thermoflexibacter ruber]|uniref:beta-N-acetylhexosaminidase n=1 Tax=Thermoflexibacter ruber TaxID=1003 RepID=A0A1I2IXR7_9BACT|nr:glycoside hydrolase family 3 N-terminal domain-containing protein [Thermoflexibacter ruber]SFF46393.1 beta-glucosidase [Thermoflexibacter ruber]
MKKRNLFLFIPLTFTLLGLTSVETKDEKTNVTAYLNRIKKEIWVDSVFNTFSEEDKIAQLFFAAAYSNRSKAEEDAVSNLIKKHHIGGLVFFQGSPTKQAELTNRYQTESNVPLMIAMDAEWGLGMRLDSTISFPYQMALGATAEDNLIYEMGAEIAQQFKRIGMHINFAPVADVNNNANNPVINYRSFGEDKVKVVQKAYAYMKGMQDNGLITSAKHFPGHGDTDVDSHYGLPVIKHSRERLEDIELYPFKELINKGLNGIMVAHMNIPALDNTPNLPTTLSQPVITNLLRNDLGFKGLIFTDAMNMKGVTAYHPAGEAEVKALLAGNDIMELSENIPKAIEAIKSAVKQGVIQQESINEKCKKVLTAKYDLGLAKWEKINLNNLTQDLNNEKAKTLNRQLSAATLTLLKNEANLLPLKNIEKQEIAVISIGSGSNTSLQNKANELAKIESFSLPITANSQSIQKVKSKLRKFDVVIVGLHDTQKRPNNKVEYSADLQSFIGELAQNPKSVIVVLKNPYTLARFKNIEKTKQLIMMYYDCENAQEAAINFIFGKGFATGKMPVSVGNFKAGEGIEVK